MFRSNSNEKISLFHSLTSLARKTLSKKDQNNGVQDSSFDGLIHNAGVSIRARASETKAQIYQGLMAVNYFSMVYLFKASLSHIEKNAGAYCGHLQYDE